MKKVQAFLLLFLAIGHWSCWNIEPSAESFKRLAPGPWRAIFILGEGETEDLVQANLDMFVEQVEGSEPEFYFFSGLDTLRPSRLRYLNDTIWAEFDEHKTVLRINYEIELMKGGLYEAETGKPKNLLFSAHRGYMKRFPDLGKEPVGNLSGLWRLSGQSRGGEQGNWDLFIEAEGTKLRGYWADEKAKIPLAGTIQGGQILLSGFDGGQAVLLKAKTKDAQRIEAGALYLNRQTWAFEGEPRRD